MSCIIQLRDHRRRTDSRALPPFAAALVFMALLAFAAVPAFAANTAAAAPDTVTHHGRVSPMESAAVSAADLQRIYDEVRTPYKYGVVLRGHHGQAVDCPAVFRHEGHWYMTYICMNDVGYETHLATSDDLLAWREVGTILPFRKAGWDAWQAGGSVALEDYTWGGSYEVEPYDGRYWISYVGGALQGYETDPLSMGLAWSPTPTSGAVWSRWAGNPIMTPADPDARDFEKLTLYRSNILRDPARTLGEPFVMFYNAKQRGEHIERIGMALSGDLVHWKRYGPAPVVDNGTGITGDPQVAKIGDLWVMFYFGAFWQPKAFDTFACSRDLVHWTKWTGPHLVEPSVPWDEQYAHKPWVVKHDGVVYHYYCAVGSEGRVIALATSKDLQAR